MFQLPDNHEDWRKIAQEFETSWNFPHCVGALDGKHIVMQAPIHSGSEFYNYKHTFSVVLMASVDANYSFTFADIGCQGRISDGGVFRNCTLGQKLDTEQLMLPPDKPLPQREVPVPYVFVADDAFPLSRRILKPYPGTHDKGTLQRVFNYRLSRSRRIVENAFGIMSSVFRILRKPMLLQPDKASLVTITCVLLHNFLRKSKTSKNKYSPPGTFDVEDEGRIIPGLWRQEPASMTSFLRLNRIGRKSSTEAQSIRREFAEYFTSVGKVEWQDEYS